MPSKIEIDHTQLPTKNGHYERQASFFRDRISSAPGAEFPPEKDRYVLYVNYLCPFAGRTNLVRTLKGLESIIQLVVLDWQLFPEGWSFTGRDGTDPVDPLYGFTSLSQLYLKASPDYNGRFTVPILWDKEKETIVSNESSEIVRMFYKEFDELLPLELRENEKEGGGFLPEHLVDEIEVMNEWIYNDINNGVYKAGFSTSQSAYQDNYITLFSALDKIEFHLQSQKYPGPYLFGEHITDADIRLFPTIVRFDVAYYTLFMCNLKMIRYEYPAIQGWFENLFWDESERTRGAFRKSTDFESIRKGYTKAVGWKVVPLGPLPLTAFRRN